eukprot:516243-Prymnesium_polylepis.2
MVEIVNNFHLAARQLAVGVPKAVARHDARRRRRRLQRAVGAIGSAAGSHGDPELDKLARLAH